MRYAFVVATQRHYITTAIDYPNAAPHMGHEARKDNLRFSFREPSFPSMVSLSAGTRETRASRRCFL
jgi:hypothetical protein